MMHIISYFNLVIFYFFIFVMNSYAQQEDYQVGLNPGKFQQTQGAFYDYSDSQGLNIKVSIWGYVKFPGRYVIPERTDIKDFISFAGGVNDDAYLDEIRIYRVNSDSTQEMLKFDYEDLWWSEDLKQDLNLYKLQPGDVLIIPGRDRLYWENYFSLGLSVVSILLSIATLIVTLNN